MRARFERVRIRAGTRKRLDDCLEEAVGDDGDALNPEGPLRLRLKSLKLSQ